MAKDADGLGEPTRSQSVSDGGGRSWLWWSLGSAAMIAGGVGAYVVLANDDSPERKTISADGTIK
jgi:hypothetical protein